MADPVKTARQMFDQFLAKADPEARNHELLSPKERESKKKAGEKGGMARSAVLSSAQRSKIAKKAAKARWSQTSNT